MTRVPPEMLIYPEVEEMPIFRDDDNLLPIMLPSSRWGVQLIGLDWRQEHIGLGVDRVPFDPENRWPLA